QDASGWHVTNIIGNNASYDHIMLSFDLNNNTVSFSYYASLTGVTTLMASDVAAAAPIDFLSGIHFTAQANTEKNTFDDFGISASIAVVPEPSSLLVLLVGGLTCLGRRRRK
ncbi:MAG: hypothetical protein JWO08_4241, partial [Verrucomicrobiaceae bacterium]|nr:hypothetical protein [Verrucomicrobiaceae bacterium]